MNFLFTLLLLSITSIGAYDVPINDGFVTDEVGILTAEQEEVLEQQLREYQTGSGIEIAILIIDNSNQTPLSDIATATLRDWGVGNKDNNDGVVLVHEYSTREVFITTGYGAEGFLPDLVVAGILDTDVIPAFREADYFEGYSKGASAIASHYTGEFDADRYKEPLIDSGNNWFWFFVVIQLFASFLARSKSIWAGGLIGLIAGIICLFIWGWWLSIPALIILGLIIDYVLSNASHKSGGNRIGYSGYRSKRSRSRSWRGFGGGTGGGGGAGRSY